MDGLMKPDHIPSSEVQKLCHVQRILVMVSQNNIGDDQGFIRKVTCFYFSQYFSLHSSLCMKTGFLCFSHQMAEGGYPTLLFLVIVGPGSVWN